MVTRLFSPERTTTPTGSRSAATTVTTTKDDQWGGGVLPASGDTCSFGSMSGLVNKSGSNGGKNGGGKADTRGALLIPRKMLSKMWSGKASNRENSHASDTSESPSSINLEAETKSKHSGNPGIRFLSFGGFTSRGVEDDDQVSVLNGRFWCQYRK